MSSRPTLVEAIAEAKGLSEAIRSTLAAQLDAAAMTHKSKVPFKALTLRELLLHRVSALASPAVSLLEQNEFLPAAVLSRSLLETASVLHGLNKHLDAAVHMWKHDALDKFVIRSLMASRDPEATYQATNVLGLVDSLNKRVPGFRAAYDAMSEYTHPNWSGLFGSFGAFDHDRLIMNLGVNERTDGSRRVAIILAATLSLVRDLYNKMVPLLKALNAQYESGPVA